MFAKDAVPVKVGEAEKTRLPVPVSSVRASMRYWEVPEVVRKLLVSVKTAREAVSEVTLRFVVVAVPSMVRPVAPVPPPMVDDAETTIPFVEDGVMASAPVFSIQFEPPVTEMVDHLVEVPVDMRYWPFVPVVLALS